MANDPGLAGDTCYFMEAVSGDGGTHDPAGVWWLSPDILLTGPVSGPDNADPGQVNPVEVKFHRKAANSDCTTPGDESITVELWVGNPSLAMAPNNQASTFAIQSIGAQVPAPGNRQMLSGKFDAEQQKLFSAGRSARGATQYLYRSVSAKKTGSQPT